MCVSNAQLFNTPLIILRSGVYRCSGNGRKGAGDIQVRPVYTFCYRAEEIVLSG